MYLLVWSSYRGLAKFSRAAGRCFYGFTFRIVGCSFSIWDETNWWEPYKDKPPRFLDGEGAPDLGSRVQSNDSLIFSSFFAAGEVVIELYVFRVASCTLRVLRFDSIVLRVFFRCVRIPASPLSPKNYWTPSRRLASGSVAVMSWLREGLSLMTSFFRTLPLSCLVFTSFL